MQTNKVKKLVTACPNLALFETVDSAKLASKLNKELALVNRTAGPLPVLIQVNTSQEGTKSGVDSAEVPALVSHIRTACPLLRFNGLMAMGAIGDIQGFETMAALRDILVGEDLSAGDFILSMGTSGDYEAAIQHGATEVRLGTTIFGARNYAGRV